MTLAKPIDVPAQATRLDAIEGRYDRWLLGAILSLLVLGIVMVTSASLGLADVMGLGSSTSCSATCSRSASDACWPGWR